MDRPQENKKWEGKIRENVIMLVVHLNDVNEKKSARVGDLYVKEENSQSYTALSSVRKTSASPF
jgi:hypothetical protein